MRVSKFCVLALSLMLLAGCGLTKSDEERLRDADAYMEEGNYRTAVIEIKTVLNNNPDNADARLKLATVLLGLNDVLGAEKEMQRAAELGASSRAVSRLVFDIWAAQGKHLEILASLGRDDSALSDIEVLKYRGKALVATGKAEAALRTYEEWLAVEPNSLDARIGKARAIAIGGDREAAISQLNEIVSEYPGSVDAWLALGNFNYASGEYALAEVAYSKSLESSQPQTNIRRYLFTLTGLADAQLFLRKLDPARLTVSRLVGYAPTAPQSLWLQARLAQMEDDFFEAARALNELRLQTPDDVRVLMSLGNVQARLGNFGQAQALFERVVALAPDNVQARKQLADVQLRQNDTTGAVEVLAPLLEQLPGDTDLYALMATADIQGGDEGAAIERLLQAHLQNPVDRTITIRLADTYLQDGNAGEAVELLTDLSPSVTEPFARERVLMASLKELGRIAEAVRVGDELVERQANNVKALRLVGALKMSVGRSGAARELFEKAREIEPSDSQTLVMLASLEFQSGNIAAASEIYESLNRSARASLEALMGLAQIANKEGNVDKSIEYLERARAEFPEAVMPRLVLAQIYLAIDRTGEADILARELAAIGSTSSDVLELVGKVFLETGAIEESEAQYKLAVGRDSGSVGALLGLARSYMTQGKMTETQQTLEKVLELDSNSQTANAILTLADIRSGNLDDAERRIRRFRSSNPDSVVGMAVEGEVLYARGDYAGAAEAFRSAVEGGAGINAVIREFQTRVEQEDDTSPEMPLTRWLADNPEDIRAREYLAQFYQRQSIRDKAIAEYESLLVRDPGNPRYLNNLAIEYQRTGDLDRAVTLAEKSNELQPNSPALMDTLGWIYRERGQLERSVELLSNASRLAPDDGETHFHYAVVLIETGNKSRAKEVLASLTNSDMEFSSRQLAEDLLRDL